MQSTFRINTKIDPTSGVMKCLAGTWDATNKVTKVMPAGPSAAEVAAYMGIFESDKRKLGKSWTDVVTYEDIIAMIVGGDAWVEVDGAVEIGDMLEFSASVAGKFTKRTFATLSAEPTKAEVEAEMKKQVFLPRIKVIMKMTEAGKCQVVVL